MTATIELHARQYEFVTSPARRAAFIGGIGSGKTIAGCVRALDYAGRRKCLGIVAAPTYPMLRDATLRAFLEIAGERVFEFFKGEMRAELVNGSEVLFRTADNPERLRGPTVSWVYLDEAARCHYDAWRVLIGRARQHGEAGPAWLTTTPKGRNWVWEYFVRDGDEGKALFRSRTQDNPYLAEEYIADLERDYVGQFAAQELGGEFVALEGLIYEEFSRDVHVWRRDLPVFERVVAGVDWGYTHPATVIVLGLDSDGRAYAVDEFYRRGVRLEEHVRAAEDARVRWGVETFYCDPAEPEHIAEMRLAGLSAVAANNAVMPGIQAVKARLAVQGDGRPRLYTTPQTANLMAEFESYAWREKRGGEMVDQPEKVNDHAMDALRYAIMGADVGGITLGII